MKLKDGMKESEKLDLILKEIENIHGEYPEMRMFLDFIMKHRNQVFLYLRNFDVEKT